MPQWTVQCWSCGHAMEFDIKPGRAAECSKCAEDVRCCRNCVYYDTAVSNQCREPTADFVSNKERGNFCGMFDPSGDNQGEGAGKVDDARAKLDALFKI